MNKRELVNQSINLMLEHLDDSFTVQDVASHFHYSEFYFSRVFKAVTGESVYAFYKHLKMNQSAIDLKLNQHKSVTDIGLDYGYSASNYSWVFKQHHRLSPAQFRKQSRQAQIHNPFQPDTVDCVEPFSYYDERMKIEVLQDVRVIYERVFGSYGDLKEKWYRFLDAYQDYITTDTLMIERFFDDPAIYSGGLSICDLCITAPRTYKSENVTVIKGGKFAVFRFEGEIKDIFRTLQGIFAVWFPQSGYVMDERYGLNIYHGIDKGTDRVVMDVCVPIK